MRVRQLCKTKRLEPCSFKMIVNYPSTLSPSPIRPKNPNNCHNE